MVQDTEIINHGPLHHSVGCSASLWKWCFYQSDSTAVFSLSGQHSSSSTEIDLLLSLTELLLDNADEVSKDSCCTHVTDDNEILCHCSLCSRKKRGDISWAHTVLHVHRWLCATSHLIALDFVSCFEWFVAVLHNTVACALRRANSVVYDDVRSGVWLRLEWLTVVITRTGQVRAQPQLTLTGWTQAPAEQRGGKQNCSRVDTDSLGWGQLSPTMLIAVHESTHTRSVIR